MASIAFYGLFTISYERRTFGMRSKILRAEQRSSMEGSVDINYQGLERGDKYVEYFGFETWLVDNHKWAL